MLNILMHPPVTGANGLSVHGRSYHSTGGKPVAAPECDAVVLEANGWTSAGPVGATAERPANPKRGDTYNDSSVGAVVKFDGIAWRHVTTGELV